MQWYSYLHHDIDLARPYDDARSRQAIAYMDELTAHRDRTQGVIKALIEDRKTTGDDQIKGRADDLKRSSSAGNDR